MKVRMLKDWGFHKAGAKVDIFDSVGRQWLNEKIAEPWQDVVEAATTATEAASRALEATEASLPEPEHAVVQHKPRRGRPPKVK